MTVRLPGGGMDRRFERIGVARATDPNDLPRALALAREHGRRFGGEPDALCA